ncbi:MAG: hypothetical protein NTY19_04185 [Planctomycetota bacterium]|nr:hypothetical protein [Planctomycetota bacterium]
MSRAGGGWSIAFLTCLLLVLSGCASGPYQYGCKSDYLTSPELAAITQPQIEQGQPRSALDGIGWVVGIPSKIILWDRRVDDHDISLETAQAIADYLAVNELDTVKVRLNQYAPKDEWHRLVANTSVAWGWRYTCGTLSWLEDTLLPGRIFGGDHFNAYTNTISLFSDVPAIAAHEAGHAKDFARRTYKGTYAALYAIPGTALWYEAVATKDALGYCRAERSAEEEQEAYRVLYPAYGTYLGSTLSEFSPGPSSLIYAAAVIPGHVLGRIQARRVMNERADGTESPPPQAEAPVEGQDAVSDSAL